MTIKTLQLSEVGMSNQVNLCDSCCYVQPTCEGNNMIFGDGVGNDNVVSCSIYEAIYNRPHPHDSESIMEMGITT